MTRRSIVPSSREVLNSTYTGRLHGTPYFFDFLYVCFVSCLINHLGLIFLVGGNEVGVFDVGYCRWGMVTLKLISTITSQVRSLLLVKELADDGLRLSQIVSATGMAPFVAEKALRQIGRFSPAQLEGAYRELLSTDAALKRSRLTPDMALDLLVVNFGNS